ncbi:MAG: response regulator transcription factor [Bacteroidetes bacterium]|nr:response regulator transcription factor [Bacteroidota bacterium]
MNTLKVLVADDEAPARNKMVRMLQSFDQVDIINISSNGLDAYNYICQLKPDVAFLDIEMPGMNGLEIIENLPPDVNPQIVFATAYNEHAIRAFELSAIDYLLKPFNEERLAQTLEKLDKQQDASNPDRVREAAEVIAPHLSPSALNKIPVPAGDRYRLLDYDEVVCIEVEDRCTQIYTISKQYSLNLTLEAVEKRLPQEQFLRVSRSAIVNIHAIQEIVMWFGNRFKIILNNGKEVITSRERAKHVKQMLKF